MAEFEGGPNAELEEEPGSFQCDQGHTWEGIRIKGGAPPPPCPTCGSTNVAFSPASEEPEG